MPDSAAPLTSPSVEIHELTKHFGRITALDHLSLRLDRGDFLLIFGRNGAGKTTLLRLLSALARPSSGTFRIEQQDVHVDAVALRRAVGFMSHHTYLYNELTAMENLEFFARLFSVSSARQRIEELLEKVRLQDRAQDPVRQFSRGMMQRLAIARAFLHDPQVLLLDEPYTGLDPDARETFDRLLIEAHQRSKTVMLTTHDLDFNLPVVTRVMMLDRGRKVYDAPSPPERPQPFRDLYAEYVRPSR